MADRPNKPTQEGADRGPARPGLNNRRNLTALHTESIEPALPAGYQQAMTFYRLLREFRVGHYREFSPAARTEERAIPRRANPTAARKLVRIATKSALCPPPAAAKTVV